MDEAGFRVSSSGVPERGRLWKSAAHKKVRKRRRRRSYIPDLGSSASRAWRQRRDLFSLKKVEKDPKDEEIKPVDPSYVQPSM